MGSPTYSALAATSTSTSEYGLESTGYNSAPTVSPERFDNSSAADLIQFRSPHYLWASQFIDNIQSRASRMALLQQPSNIPRITGVASLPGIRYKGTPKI